MLIRTIVLTIALAACGFESSPDTPTDARTAEVSQGVTCERHYYSCLPRDIWANWSCEEACGGAGHCAAYTAAEEDFCWRHPGAWFNQLKQCSESGDPAWRTWCVPGPTP